MVVYPKGAVHEYSLVMPVFTPVLVVPKQLKQP